MNNDTLDGLIIHHKPINQNALKRLLLIFDHIYFLDPIENLYMIPTGVAEIDYTFMITELNSYGFFHKGQRNRIKEERLLNQFDYPISLGIIKILKLQEDNFYQSIWVPLRIAYEFDTANINLLQTLEPLIERNKLQGDRPDPREIRAGIPNGPQPPELIKNFFNLDKIPVFPTIPETSELFTPEDQNRFHSDIQIFSIIGKLDRALVVCDKYNLVPIFLNEQIAKAFVIKFEIAKANKESNLKEAFNKINSIQLPNVQHFLLRMSEILISNEVLQKIPVKELITARNNTFEEFYKLRRRIIESYHFLSQNSFDENFIRVVEEYIQKDLQPAFDDYKSKFWSRLAAGLKVSLSITFGALGTTIGVTQSLSPLAIAFLSGTTATIGNYVSELANYIVKKEKDAFRNSFSYFLKLIE